MADWLLLGLIAGLMALLLLTIFGVAVYSGLLTEVVVGAGTPPIRSITIAYKFRVGPYDESGNLFTESCNIAPKLPSIGVYYDNVLKVPVEFCRYLVGTIIGEGEEQPREDLTRQFEKNGYKIITFPEVSHAVTTTFPYTTPFSIQLATTRVHSALNEYIKERKLCAHPYIEIYKGDQIQFVCPLSRQSDFYVPEMKALLKKLREEEEKAALEGTGADTLSDSSSVSLEAPDDSREPSVATTMTTDTPTIRNREEPDNRSEHSYSESGASCSSFEELDLEASASDGPGGRPPPMTQLGYKLELDSSKWAKEPLLSEKIRGEE
ncbi:testis-expressed protein 264 [Ambystoma mexicanum]|uniref:testis-expressed protein 264 n=1 Tax=Ambystoma mexicanum TaxID=8296 RepID=UPI0037E71843